MKNLTTTIKTTICAFLFLAALTLNADEVSQQTKYDPSGTWDYEVETPDGNLTGEMTVKLTEGKYEVVIKTDVYGNLTLADVAFEKMLMEGSISVEGQSMSIEFKFDGDDMEGAVYTGEDELAITAKRQKSK